MHWFAVMAAAAFTKKLIMRYRRGLDVQRILEDPPEIRTLARFELVDPKLSRAVLEDLGEALMPHLGAWHTTAGALVARREDASIEVVKVTPRAPPVFTLELTRAWTGPRLDLTACDVLLRIHDVLEAHHAVRALAWHGRQDRALAFAHALPVAALP
ncbi:MAG: hypothetical protein SFX73_02280 [Kofleriaceae bacterium]|nr:hypothetical protein [Kofleriaceae bacterium]